jgi:TonB-linked SusC/RagA family outer membrane protein
MLQARPPVASRFARRLVRLAVALATVAVVAPMAMAQQAGSTITGVVKDVLTGLPIEGVSVTVVGAPKGARTNAEGRYTITGLSAGVYAIEARRVSYQLGRQSDVRASGSDTRNVDFQLSQTSLQLEAITSSATVDPISGKKAPFAVAKLEADAFPVPTTGAANAIANKIPGVSVTRGSGDPSDEAWVQLRSMSSPFKNNGPLWVIDGIPLNTTAQGNIGSIRTTDIESLDIASIEVIKGAAAAAQYGSAAAGGVINITTNRGKDIGLGSAEIQVRTDMGYDAIPHQLPPKRQYHAFLMNSEGQWINSNGVPVTKGNRVFEADRIMDNKYVRTYDNVRQALRANQVMVNQVRLQQNSVSTNYSISYNRTANPGIVRNAKGNLNQNVRFNVAHQFRDNLDFTVNLNHGRVLSRPSQTSFSQLFSWDPDVNLNRPDITGAQYVITPDTGSTSTNPLYLQLLRERETRSASSDFSSGARFRPFTWLTFEGNLGYRRSDRITDNFEPPGLPDTDGSGFTDGSLEYVTSESDIVNASTGLTFLRDIGRLTTRLRVGAEAQRDRNLRFSASGSDFAVTGVRDLTGATSQENGSTISEARVNSLVSSGALDYAGRYALNASVRREGNSLFGPLHRYNIFHGIGVSWIVSNESWYPAFLNSINTFKFRYNYGTAGTKPDFGDQYETIDISSAGFVRSGLGNPNLKPEMKFDHEMGLDLLINNRVSLAYTYVDTRTRDAIVGVEAPAASGFNLYTRNVGATHGMSHEFQIEGAVIQRPRGLRWTTSIQASRSKMDVDHYGRTCYAETPDILYRCPGIPVTTYWGSHFMNNHDELAPSRSGSKNQWQVDNNGFLVPVGLDPITGNPNNWWEGKSKGLWGTVVTIDGVAYNWGTPTLQWSDVANEQGQIAGDVVYKKIGDWQPLFEYGWTNRFNKGQLVFGLTVGGQVGGDIYDLSSRELYNSLDHPDAVQVGVPDSLAKGIEYYDGGGVGSLSNGTYNDYFVFKNASFLKVREAVVGYTLDAQKHRFINKIGATRVNLQLLGRDLWRFMPGYEGVDPEGFIGLSGGINTRMDTLRYPPGRRFTGSVTLVF